MHSFQYITLPVHALLVLEYWHIYCPCCVPWFSEWIYVPPQIQIVLIPSTLNPMVYTFVLYPLHVNNVIWGIYIQYVSKSFTAFTVTLFIRFCRNTSLYNYSAVVLLFTVFCFFLVLSIQ